MAYETNRFCWHGLISTDTEKAAVFYQEALGWKVLSMPMGDATAHMFTASEVPFAHFMAPPTEGVPSHWSNYLRVEDLDASTKSAVDNGGTLVVPQTAIPPGRFSVVLSPSGAAISLFHEADEGTAEHHPGGVGGVHWTELQSQDVDKDLAWLKSTFGFEVSEMPMPEGKYYILNHGGQPRGGVMAAMMAEAPSMWVSWFHVDDADAAVERVVAQGGKAYSPLMDMEGVGRMAVVADSTGAVFGVIKPADAQAS